MKNPITRAAVAFLLLLTLVSPTTLFANPADGVVTFGNAEFSGGNGRLTIRQGTEAAIIDWGDFSIRKGELTEFIQPNSRSAVLNRVVSGNPSAIDGALRANGSVFVINPNGILVGPSGTIDVGGSAVLSTLDIDNDSFLAGGDLLFKGTTDAGVVNMGRISAIEGDVFIFGNTVSNQGTITAPNGTVGLAAGGEILLSAEANRSGERVFVKAGGFRGDVGVENSGTIEAAAAELKAHGNLYALAINNSGSIRATGANRRGGGVFLRSIGGRVENTGTIEATVPGSRGGQILIEADTFDMGGTLKTDPEGSIDLIVKKVNLLPGATIGDQNLGELIAESGDTQYLADQHVVDPMRKATDPPGIPASGKITAAGRFAAGAPQIVASRKNGRVMIGMPGVTRTRPDLLPKPAATKPATSIIREVPTDEADPASTARIDRNRPPSAPGGSTPASPDGRPPITPPAPPAGTGTGTPRP